MNILKKADEIMNARSEEKDREYGPFAESIERAAIIATQMCDVPISSETFCKCLIALKLGRLKFNIKDDTLLDAVAYIDGLQKVRDAHYCKDDTLLDAVAYIDGLQKIRDSQDDRFFLDPADLENYAKIKCKDEENE